MYSTRSNIVLTVSGTRIVLWVSSSFEDFTISAGKCTKIQKLYRNHFVPRMYGVRIHVVDDNKYALCVAQLLATDSTCRIVRNTVVLFQSARFMERVE